MYTTLTLKFLRIAPLITSTAGLMCAWDQQWTFAPFVHPSVPQGPAGQVLPHWFPVVFSKLIWVVSIVHPLGGLLGLLNGLGSPGAALDSQTRKLYLAGGFFAAMHAVYGKTAMRMIGVIWDTKVSGEKNLAEMPPWLRMNWWRIMTMNVPAVFLFLAAVLRAIEVQKL